MCASGGVGQVAQGSVTAGTLGGRAEERGGAERGVVGSGWESQISHWEVLPGSLGAHLALGVPAAGCREHREQEGAGLCLAITTQLHFAGSLASGPFPRRTREMNVCKREKGK